MKSITIKGTKRESVGKKATRALRNADHVPCVLYGGEEAIHFSAEEKAFRNLVYTPNIYMVVIELGDSKYRAIMQDIQFHPVTDRILHVDFYQIYDDREITMNIPVRTLGTPAGVRAGGVLLIMNRALAVKALPDNMPDYFELDISKMKIGEVMDINVIEQDGFEILAEENAPICQVRTSRRAVATGDDEDDEDEDEEGETPAAEEAASEE